jgi:hypothetical protein
MKNQLLFKELAWNKFTPKIDNFFSTSGVLISIETVRLA